MVNFILKSMDGNAKVAVLAVALDYSKAFNRMSHAKILDSLAVFNLPTCAIRLIKSYLTRRNMCIRCKVENQHSRAVQEVAHRVGY